MNLFEKIYSEYKYKVYFFVKKYIQKEEDTEDIVQDIFIHVWRHMDKTDQTPPESIIFKTCKQEVSKFYRRNKLLFTFSEEEILIEEEEVFDEDLYKEQISKVERLLNEFPQKTRDLFIQHKIENISYSQLAKENNLSKTAVSKQVNKILSFLKDNLHLLLIII
ncbi:RNA polymerase sigma-70 factor, ECF subfamily [Chryseobacterium ureilyticum]|uniref:RNA polymerase sigma-70 factor, ECF subfamily n=1 Tax=Chryseobacterium ureilyticum TaxID=373668 RepID=A0A1N7QQL5_9FLAO|nr:sigma-70 family RNA polymerase sigma factor [Chryseobacterium ureilyticum]SIT25049.1 RNA polymerase sigma-70 factor, ECF subfamily [Chryseobacterium ureilyticum]